MPSLRFQFAALMAGVGCKMHGGFPGPAPKPQTLHPKSIGEAPEILQSRLAFGAMGHLIEAFKLHHSYTSTPGPQLPLILGLGFRVSSNFYVGGIEGGGSVPGRTRMDT